MNEDPFAFMDATEQAELVRKGEVKPIELCEAAIKRIENLNHQLNAVIFSMDDLARVAARQAVAPEMTFPGVPFLLKDLVAEYAGTPITEGSRFLNGCCVSTHDSELVTRLKATGAIVVGKTNTPEFGLLPTTEPVLFGPSHNPWDTSLPPGGSSGGSAAAGDPLELKLGDLCKLLGLRCSARPATSDEVRRI